MQISPYQKEIVMPPQNVLDDAINFQIALLGARKSTDGFALRLFSDAKCIQ